MKVFTLKIIKNSQTVQRKGEKNMNLIRLHKIMQMLILLFPIAVVVTYLFMQYCSFTVIWDFLTAIPVNKVTLCCSTIKVYGYTSMLFHHFFSKGSNFCDFLFAF